MVGVVVLQKVLVNFYILIPKHVPRCLKKAQTHTVSPRERILTKKIMVTAVNSIKEDDNYFLIFLMVVLLYAFTIGGWSSDLSTEVINFRNSYVASIEYSFTTYLFDLTIIFVDTVVNLIPLYIIVIILNLSWKKKTDDQSAGNLKYINLMKEEDKNE